jgi:hypothetical protein
MRLASSHAGSEAMRRRVRRFVRDRSGTNLVEAAIVTPLLLFLTFSLIELATVFFVYLALENGVTQATRAGVTGSQGPGRAAALVAAMRAATPALTIPDGAVTFSHLPPGGSSWVGGIGAPNDIEKMTVSYTWRLMTPVLRPLFPTGQVQIRVESSRKTEGSAQ